MIASVFKKSTPLNYALVVFLMLFFFCIYQFQDSSWTGSTFLIAKKAVVFLVLVTSVFLTSFIAIKNGLTKDSAYTAFFYFLLLLFSPTLLDDLNLALANFFILLALRRLISLQSMKASKEKIFDASLWIFIASLFHFWSILFLLLVFIAIVFRVATDYRNWALPFIAFFTVGILFLVFALSTAINLEAYFYHATAMDFKLGFFSNNAQNAAFSIYVSVALFFIVSMFITLSNRASINQISYKIIIASFFIGAVIFLISANKSNDLLVMTFAPLAIMGAAHIEYVQEQLKKNIVIGVFMICSIWLFLAQL